MIYRPVDLIFLAVGCTAAVADDRFDAIWSHATLYDNPDNPVLQRFALNGRAQYEWVNSASKISIPRSPTPARR